MLVPKKLPALLRGTCFLKAVWDINKGSIIGEQDGVKLREGDVSVSVVPPFELFPEQQSFIAVEIMPSP